MRKRATAAVSGLRRRLSSGQVEAPSVPVHFNLLPEAEHWPNSGRVGEQRLMLVQYWRQMQGETSPATASKPAPPAPAPVREKAPPARSVPEARPHRPATGVSLLRDEPGDSAARVIVTPPPPPRVIVTSPPIVTPPAAVTPPPAVTPPVAVTPPAVAPPLVTPVEADSAPTKSPVTAPAANRSFVINSKSQAPAVAKPETPEPEPRALVVEPVTTPVVADAYAFVDADAADDEDAAVPAAADARPLDTPSAEGTVAAPTEAAEDEIGLQEVDLPSIDLPAVARPAAPDAVADLPVAEMRFDLPDFEAPAPPVGEDIDVEEQDVDLPAGLFAHAPGHSAGTASEAEPPPVEDFVFDLDVTPVQPAAAPDAPSFAFSADSLVQPEQADRVDDQVTHTVEETFDVAALSGSVTLEEPILETAGASPAFDESYAAVELTVPVLEDVTVDVAGEISAVDDAPARASAEMAVEFDAIGEILADEPTADIEAPARAVVFHEPIAHEFLNLDLEAPESAHVEAAVGAPPADVSWKPFDGAAADWLVEEAPAPVSEAPAHVAEAALPVVEVAPAIVEPAAEVEAPVAVASAPISVPVQTRKATPATDLSDGGQAAPAVSAAAEAMAESDATFDGTVEWTVSARDIRDLRRRRTGVIPMPPARSVRRSPLPELERFLRAARARHEQVKSESVA